MQREGHIGDLSPRHPLISFGFRFCGAFCRRVGVFNVAKCRLCDITATSVAPLLWLSWFRDLMFWAFYVVAFCLAFLCVLWSFLGVLSHFLGFLRVGITQNAKNASPFSLCRGLFSSLSLPPSQQITPQKNTTTTQKQPHNTNKKSLCGLRRAYCGAFWACGGIFYHLKLKTPSKVLKMPQTETISKLLFWACRDF